MIREKKNSPSMGKSERKEKKEQKKRKKGKRKTGTERVKDRETEKQGNRE